VSVFIERHDAKRHRRPALTVRGATQSLTLHQGEWWITVVGDAPIATLRLFANGLERRK
jgi:sigma-E factor negative regulatory protein RseB